MECISYEDAYKHKLYDRNYIVQDAIYVNLCQEDKELFKKYSIGFQEEDNTILILVLDTSKPKWLTFIYGTGLGRSNFSISKNELIHVESPNERVNYQPGWAKLCVKGEGLPYLGDGLFYMTELEIAQLLLRGIA